METNWERECTPVWFGYELLKVQQFCEPKSEQITLCQRLAYSGNMCNEYNLMTIIQSNSNH